MNTRQTQLLTAITAFAGGFIVGLLIAPQSGREARRRIAQSAQGSTRWIEDQLHSLEDQLGTLEQHIQSVSAQFGDKVRDVTHKAVDQYLPSFPEESNDWEMEGEDLERNLRHLPRK